jgi:hypothetical protein
LVDHGAEAGETDDGGPGEGVMPCSVSSRRSPGRRK